MAKWCVKVKRYSGGTSVEGVFDDKAAAESIAALRNCGYQTDAYYVEEWVEGKIEWPSLAGKGKNDAEH